MKSIYCMGLESPSPLKLKTHPNIKNTRHAFNCALNISPKRGIIDTLITYLEESNTNFKGFKSQKIYIQKI